MDHTEAVRLQAAEKYLLNEFTPPQREEYEEHYFDCYECAEDVKATASFLEGVRQLTRPGVLEPQMLHGAVPAVTRAAAASRGFFARLKPAFAVPVFAALLLFIGYQNSITIPRLKNAESAAPEIQKYFALPPVGARAEGATPVAVKVRANQGFVLEADMPGNSDNGYLCLIKDRSERTLYSLSVSSAEAKNTVQIRIPGGALQPGNYRLVILKGQGSSSAAGGAADSSSLQFTVEFLP